MRDFLRRLVDALSGSGPGDEPAQADTSLRAALDDLAGRWERTAANLTAGHPTEFFVEPNPVWERQAAAAHTYCTAASDVRDVLRTGLPPHPLMTGAELQQHGTPEETTR